MGKFYSGKFEFISWENRVAHVLLKIFGKIFLENFEKFYLGIVVKVLWRHVVLKNVFESHISYGPIGFPCDFKSSSKNIMKASLIMSLWWT